MVERIGLYGGTFDPIHHGHLIVARAIAERLGLDRIIFLPSATPPHKSTDALTDAPHRAEMVRLAIRNEPLFSYSDYDLTRSGPSYTIDTVNHFLQQLGQNAVVHWIIGADSLMELATWRDVATLVDTCRIVTAARPGSDDLDWQRLAPVLTEAQTRGLQSGVLDTPRIDISATGIRERVAEGRSIRFLVPDTVRAYIEKHRLYRT
ncbi:MAG: nicotinate-nucleotide adenylyltransferase [Phycisphaerae bacterium]|jgi:nicotinate-nucleotide adenylyltransferase